MTSDIPPSQGHRCAFFFCIIFLLCFIPSAGTGQTPAKPEPAVQSSETSPESTSTDEYTRIRQLVEDSLAAENENAVRLKEQLAKAEASEALFLKDVNAWEIQLSAVSGMLLTPTASVAEMERAQAAHIESLKNISEQIQTLKSRIEALKQQQLQADDQYAVNRKQVDAIPEDMADSQLHEDLIQKIEALLQFIANKQDVINKISVIYSRQMALFQELEKKFSDFLPKLDQCIRERRKETLFKREAPPVHTLDLTHFNAEISALTARIQSRLADDTATLRRRIDEQGLFPGIAFFLLLFLTEILLFRLRNFCIALEIRHGLSVNYPWFHFAIRLLCGSIVIAGALLFIYIYAHIRQIYALISIIRLICYLLFLWLFCRWSLDALSLWNESETRAIPPVFSKRLRKLVRNIRLAGIVILGTVWLSGHESRSYFWLRLAAETDLMIWCISFQRLHRRTAETAENPWPRSHFRRNLLMALIYGITAGGLLLELSGYGYLAVHWYISWGLTGILALWNLLLFKAIREWSHSHRPAESEIPSYQKKQPVSTRWLLIQVCWFFWIECVLLSLLFAWRLDKAGLADTYFSLLRTPLPVEGLNLSLMTVFYVMITLILIHLAVRIWREVLTGRLLTDSGMDTGLIHSITLISSYILWGLGILTGLSILGVNGQSIAVVFGGLGIGLGFGLQAIFNNFISGLILLFERPIQVGDVVEINGIWGEIKKINVRATLVQTYDNATLIIPNSDFISNSVINWSFKDLRVRRNILIGVAYGSDVEQVRDILLNIANTTKKVFKYPEPVVYFSDFGDSALVFRMRVWTHIDDCLAVESEIRFAVDRRFREMDIEIPFPQRDLHLRSVDPSIRFSAGEKIYEPRPASDDGPEASGKNMEGQPRDM